MNHKRPGDITFQVTVDQLTLSSASGLAKQDIRVTVCVNDVSKITCAGTLSEDDLIVTWNHPFLFSAPASMPVAVAIWILPEELTHEWSKQPLGDPVVVNVASLLQPVSTLQWNISGLSDSPALLSITSRICEVLIVPDGHDCLLALGEYKTKLYDFGISSENSAITSTKIEVELARLDLCSLGHDNHIDVLNDLAGALSKRYDQLENLSDLNRAIEIQQIRLDLCPLGHPEHAEALGWLAGSFAKHYNIQKNLADLNRLIDMEEKCLDLCPLDHPSHALALGELAVSLRHRYDFQRNIADLNRAIEMGENLLQLCPAGHWQHGTALNNLSVAISMRYRQSGNPTDLDSVIDLSEKALELRPPGHPYHRLALQNLAVSLYDRYYETNDYSDLSRVIELFRKAQGLYPVYHSGFASNAGQLALVILRASQTPNSTNQASTSMDEAFEVYRLLKKCEPATSSDLLEATQAWAKDAEQHNHSSVLEAYQTSLSTLDHFTSLTSSLDSRHEAMQARVASTASDAFSCAIRHSDYQMAVELLEKGRGILWNQVARFDISLAELESRDDNGRELRKKFMRLSADLRKHAQQSAGHETDPYWRVQEEWQHVVDKIRNLDGLSRFLLPPQFDDLQRAAESGPVIIVNASEYSCDALIVLHARAPVHVPLYCSLDDVDQLYTQLSELTQDSHAYGPNRELYVKEVLRDLWTSVVERIASVLQDDVQLPPGSRVWWCPTSKFTALPFHAAGPHRKAKKNFFDIYVSSYAPSLSALIRARDRLRSQRESRNIPGTPNVISFAAVGQAHPSADTQLGHLPEVEYELERIRNETNVPSHVKFETVIGPAASIEGAVQAFRDHRWVHVACHGAQHAEKPFDSWFAMGDGKLTLMRIIQERYTNSELAFLSACHTAKGDASTPDEVLHLAAGMQFAGFNGVIGTLWRVDDAVAHQVVTRFYKEMFKQPIIDFEHAAASLNAAVIQTADEVSLEKRIVFVHIGI